VGGLEVVRCRLARGLSVLVPAHPDALLEALGEAEFRESDERMPYFAALWPAGAALACAVLAEGSLRGLRVLDLGCGVGAPGLAAARRGGRVTFLDWEPRALELVAAAARDQRLAPETLLAADWRRPPPLAPFDLVLAADVLYEARNVPAIAAFLDRHLAPGGLARIADPGRVHAEGLDAALATVGLSVEATRALAAAGGIEVTERRVRREAAS
jgi:predicted nicotinamide N-methyase